MRREREIETVVIALCLFCIALHYVYAVFQTFTKDLMMDDASVFFVRELMLQSIFSRDK
jgi:hypothetical protein